MKTNSAKNLLNPPLPVLLIWKEAGDKSIYLCTLHFFYPTCYTKLYRLCTLTQNCSSCGAIPKPGSKFSCHSPNSLLVAKYFKDSIGTDLCIIPEDLICTSCYNLHCTIIKSIKCKQIWSDEMLAKSIENGRTLK